MWRGSRQGPGQASKGGVRTPVPSGGLHSSRPRVDVRREATPETVSEELWWGGCKGGLAKEVTPGSGGLESLPWGHPPPLGHGGHMGQSQPLRGEAAGVKAALLVGTWATQHRGWVGPGGRGAAGDFPAQSEPVAAGARDSGAQGRLEGHPLHRLHPNLRGRSRAAARPEPRG